MENVTYWLGRFKNGDDEAAQKLWEGYYGKLVVMARKRLGAAPRREVDEEDFAQSAFKSFCLGTREGRFPQLDDRHDLWKVLFTITARKVTDHHRKKAAMKHGGNAVQDNDWDLDQSLSLDPSPEDVVLIGETVGELLSRLPDATLQEIAMLKMEGYTNTEIGKQVGCVRKTVQRKLDRIRKIWLS